MMKKKSLKFGKRFRVAIGNRRSEAAYTKDGDTLPRGRR
jgi:hypothetical protein